MGLAAVPLPVTLTSLLPLFSPPVQEVTPGWLAQLYVPARTMISSPGFETFTVVAIVFLGVALLSPSLLSLPVAETYRQTPEPRIDHLLDRSHGAGAAGIGAGENLEHHIDFFLDIQNIHLAVAVHIAG